jgi:hypothetical protein
MVVHIAGIVSSSPVVAVNGTVHAALCILHQVLRPRAPSCQTYMWDEFLMSLPASKNAFIFREKKKPSRELTKFICLCSNAGCNVGRDFPDVWEGRVNEPLLKTLFRDLLSQSLRCTTMCAQGKLVKFSISFNKTEMCIRPQSCSVCPCLLLRITDVGYWRNPTAFVLALEIFKKD